jgi:DNA-binding PadR family transcriptional regulator
MPLDLAYRLGVWVGTRRALRARPLVPSAWTERDGRRERYAVTPERFEALLAECEALRNRERELLELLTEKRLVEAGRRLRMAS